MNSRRPGPDCPDPEIVAEAPPAFRRAGKDERVLEACDPIPQWNASGVWDAVRWLLRGGRADGRTEIEGLLPPRVFHQELIKERALSDRTGHPFALMTFTTNGLRPPEKRTAINRLLVSVLADRTRISDTRGWFGSQIAIILPYTTANRATTLWHSIHDALLRRVRSEAPDLAEAAEVTCEVYTYPSSNDIGAV